MLTFLQAIMANRNIYIVAVPDPQNVDNLEKVVFISDNLSSAEQEYIKIDGYKVLYSTFLNTEFEDGLMNEEMLYVESNVEWISTIPCNATIKPEVLQNKIHTLWLAILHHVRWRKRAYTIKPEPKSMYGVFAIIDDNYTSLLYVTPNLEKARKKVKRFTEIYLVYCQKFNLDQTNPF
jgi:hypothetical protein